MSLHGVYVRFHALLELLHSKVVAFLKAANPTHWLSTALFHKIV